MSLYISLKIKARHSVARDKSTVHLQNNATVRIDSVQVLPAVGAVLPRRHPVAPGWAHEMPPEFDQYGISKEYQRAIYAPSPDWQETCSSSLGRRFSRLPAFTRRHVQRSSLRT